MRIIRLAVLFLILYIFNLPTILAQTSYKRVVVLDRASKLGVPFASVYCKQKQIGLYTDEKGLFTVPIDLATSDTLSISSIGYVTDKFIIQEIDSTVFLNSNHTKLNEVVIVPKGQEVTLGALKQSTHFVQNINYTNLRNQIAFLIQNKNRIQGKIMSVSVYISPNNKPKTPFRLRIYEVKDLKPFQDIINKNIIVQASKKGGWVNISLEEYNIPIDDKGIFVAVESLYGMKKSSFYKVKNISTGNTDIEYGQSMGLTDEFETAIAYQRKFDEEWIPFSVKFPNHISTATFYPMIKLKVKQND